MRFDIKICQIHFNNKYRLSTSAKTDTQTNRQIDSQTLRQTDNINREILSKIVQVGVFQNELVQDK